MSSAASLSRTRFRPPFWPTVAMLLSLAVLLGLGAWQMQRLAWKEGLIAARNAALGAPPVTFDATAAEWRSLDFRRAVATGRFRHDLEQRFGFSSEAGRPGHHLLTPLALEDGQTLLVDRGWVPDDPATTRIDRPEGSVQVAGILRYREEDRPGWFSPGNDPADRTWYTYQLEDMREALGLQLLPMVLEAGPGADAGALPRGGRTRLTLPNRHLGYAVTWFGLAAALVAVWGVFCARTSGRRS